MNTLTGTPNRKTNRLAHQKSPYLLQHQYNPVDWFAWGEEAFSRARAENKPVFLSVGYSTCHWCHVMERESFENNAVGEFLNRHFVSIKVDREERPDVDKIYMTFVQATTGQGGWPMSVFLTPDLKPFFGGTYFPPDDRYGRPGFLSLLRQIARLWEERRDEITTSASDIHVRLAEATAAPAATGNPAFSANMVRQAGLLLRQAYDSQFGGFGGAPKFPQPSTPQLMLRYARRFKDDEATRMVLHTCKQMAEGGIHDQLAGGFSRYSVDAKWLVPHFEKMLYDNAQLAQLYLDALTVSRDPSYGDSARDIFDYVLRDMTHSEGGFFSAEDADSEGHEGKFYCWTTEELARLLTPEEYQLVARYYGLTREGNFLDHSHPSPLRGQNVLSIVDPKVAEAEKSVLESAQTKMRAERALRIRPHRDDKVLASWNGLMLGAFARGYAVLGEERFRRAAERNLEFLQRNLWDKPSATLFHRWREGERDSVQLLEAYAFLLNGVVDLYEATLESQVLEFAVTLAQSMVDRFYDRERGGFWHSAQSSGEAPADLILRLKDDYDGAEPSGNSVAVLALLRLGHITGRADFRSAAEQTLCFFHDRLERTPQALTFMLQAVDFSLQEPKRVAVTGAASAELRNLLRAVHSAYEPNKVVLGTDGPVESFARTLPKGDSMVYLCVGTACQAPTNDADRIRELLQTPDLGQM